MSQTTPVTRLTLLPATSRPRPAADAPKIRRYRLASVRPPRPAGGPERFAHLRRAHD